MDLRRIHYFRFGTEKPEPGQKSLLSIAKVAKRMYLPISTVYNGLRRFQQDGLSFVDRRRTNFAKAWKRNIKLKGVVGEYLLSFEVLSDWARLNLCQRVK